MGNVIWRKFDPDRNRDSDEGWTVIFGANLNLAALKTSEEDDCAKQGTAAEDQHDPDCGPSTTEGG